MNGCLEYQDMTKLNSEHINSLPHPLMVSVHPNEFWQLIDIDVETGCLRFDVCGKTQVSHIGSAFCFMDADGNIHEPDSFY